MIENLIKIQSNIENYALYLTKRRDDTNELVQQVNLKILEKLNRYIPNTNFEAWCISITHNEWVNNMRNVRKKNMVLGVSDTFHGNMHIRENIGLNQKIRVIDNLYIREAMICHFKFGMKYKEIAESMNCSIGSVKSWIFWGRKRIIKQYARLN